MIHEATDPKLRHHVGSKKCTVALMAAQFTYQCPESCKKCELSKLMRFGWPRDIVIRPVFCFVLLLMNLAFFFSIRGERVLPQPPSPAEESRELERWALPSIFARLGSDASAKRELLTYSPPLSRCLFSASNCPRRRLGATLELKDKD